MRGWPVSGVQSSVPPFYPRLAYDMEALTADGKMKDLSGNGNHGTIVGTTDAAGEIGRARSFNGTSDKIVVPSFAGFGGAGSKLTVAAWVNPTSYSARRAVFGQIGKASCREGGQSEAVDLEED